MDQIEPKKKTSLATWIMLLLLIGLGVYVWWSVRPQSMLIGTWRNPYDTIEIFPKGNFVISGMGGTYELLSSSRARVELGGIGAIAGPQIISYEVSANQLVLNDGHVSRSFQRVSDPSYLISFYGMVRGQ